METITVSNEKISVIIPIADYESYKPHPLSSALRQVLPSGDVRYHDPEKIARGGVLSTAMKILGNQYEALLLDQDGFELDQIELSIIATEAMTAAKNSYIDEYLTEHSKYRANETFNRYLGGHRLSAGMEFELDAARAYANAAVGEIDFLELFKNTSAKYSEYRTRMVFGAARDGLKNAGEHLTADEHMESIIAFKKMMFEIERKYRNRFYKSTWIITVLRPDLMPYQIGLCRYESTL